MPLRLSARHLPTRLATGAYVLHAGMEKWHGNPEDVRSSWNFGGGDDHQAASTSL